MSTKKGPKGLLFDQVDEERRARAAAAWQPEEPPCLDGVGTIFLDVESNGLRWWDGARAGGFSLRVPGHRSWYLPFAHKGGGNLDEGVVRRWAERELRGKHIVNANTRVDVHLTRAWGVDLAEQGNTFSDVMHHAALLDDHRRRFALDVLAQEFLGKRKLDTIYDKSRMMEYPAGEVAPYACVDVELVDEIVGYTMPRLRELGLLRVLDLENRVIPVVCEMERNGARLDLELLDRWCADSLSQLNAILLDLWRETGLHVNPDKRTDLFKFFGVCRVPVPMVVDPEDGPDADPKPCFEDQYLAKIPDPRIQKLRRARKLTSLRSKYLLKYKAGVSSDGILRYALHQLRGDENGTISGRFSSTAIDKDRQEGANIQQVMSPDKQRESFGYEADGSEDEFIIRELYVPGEGDWFSADARQIEYRLFAHYSASPSILAVYNDPDPKFRLNEKGERVWLTGPEADYHDLVQEKLVGHAAVIRRLLEAGNVKRARKLTKNTNFAKLFGAGEDKISEMLDMSLEETRAFIREYNSAIPEAKILMDRVMAKAKERGWVKTLEGRRTTFPGNKRLHKAVNSIIQGSAADINKRKLVEVYENRRFLEFTLRMTVHDELDGDLRNRDKLRAFHELLNEQTTPTKVPILWELEYGPNWKAGRKYKP